MGHDDTRLSRRTSGTPYNGKENNFLTHDVVQASVDVRPALVETARPADAADATPLARADADVLQHN